MNEKCPECGAVLNPDATERIEWECGSSVEIDIASNLPSLVRSRRCYEAELAQKENELTRLRGTIIAEEARRTAFSNHETISPSLSAWKKIVALATQDQRIPERT
jgi:hypothetical protein